MKIERNSNNKFTTNFSSYGKIGFHATSSLATCQIEKIGFLPTKIFTTVDHQNTLAVAQALGIITTDYMQWLQMRSVTFAQNENDALSHIKNGNSSGQGLGTMLTVLQSIVSSGSGDQLILANNYISAINNLRQSASVVYAVNLTNAGKRITTDPQQPLYHLYFDPNAPLPKTSIVTPLDIISRLEVT